MLLDEVAPDWHRHEVHDIEVRCDPSTALESARTTVWREVPMTRVLMMVPRRRAEETVLAGLAGELGMTQLAVDANEFVMGTIVRCTATSFSEPIALPDEPRTFYREFSEPGYAKICFNFRHDGRRLTTETRVVGTDAKVRRIFALYWFAIRIPSGLTRKEWLRAVRRSLTRVP